MDAALLRRPATWARRVLARLGDIAAVCRPRWRPGRPGRAHAAVQPAGCAAAGLVGDRQPVDPEPHLPLRGARVLLVDDHPIARELASAVLRRAGADVATSADGETALQWLARETADAVLIDCEMPGLDGYATTRRLRLLPGLAKLPVIAMTGRTTPQDRRLAIAAGMNDQVDKPIRAARLIGTLQQWLPADGGRAGATPPTPGGHRPVDGSMIG